MSRAHPYCARGVSPWLPPVRREPTGRARPAAVSRSASAPRTDCLPDASLLLPRARARFPALTGRVVDDANILDPQHARRLTDKLAAFEAKTTDQLVVVTLKSLQGTSVEDFGVELGRRWQIGQKGKNNGVLLIVAPNEAQGAHRGGLRARGRAHRRRFAAHHRERDHAALPRRRFRRRHHAWRRRHHQRADRRRRRMAAACRQAAGADDALGFDPDHAAGFLQCSDSYSSRSSAPSRANARSRGDRARAGRAAGSSAVGLGLVLRLLDGGFSGGGFSGGGGSFGGGGSSGSW